MAVTATLLAARSTHVPGTSFAYADTTVGGTGGGITVVIASWADPTGISPASVGVTIPTQTLTWTQDAYVHEDTLDGHMGVTFWSAPTPTGIINGSRVGITMSGTITWACQVAVVELLGVDTSSTRVDDVGTPTFGAASDAFWLSGSIDPTTSGAALLVSVWADGITSGSGTVNAPFTELSDLYNSADDWVHLISFREAGAAGSYTAGGTWLSGPGFGESSLGIAYKAAGGDATTYTLVPHNVTPMRWR